MPLLDFRENETESVEVHARAGVAAVLHELEVAEHDDADAFPNDC